MRLRLTQPNAAGVGAELGNIELLERPCFHLMDLRTYPFFGDLQVTTVTVTLV